MKPRAAPKPKPDPRVAPIEIELPTECWGHLLRAAQQVQRRRARIVCHDPDEELRDGVRAAAINYLQRVTATEYHTLHVRLSTIGACMLAEDALEISLRDGDRAMANAGRLLTIETSKRLFVKTDDFE